MEETGEGMCHCRISVGTGEIVLKVGQHLQKEL